MVANCWPIIMLLSAEFLVHARNIRNSNGLIGHIAVDSRGLQEAKSIIEDFEHLIHAQTHLQHHRHHRPGPVRKSIISRAHAIRHSASLLEAHNSSQHEKSFTLAWNELADLTSEEYSSFLKSRPQTIGTRSRDSQEANANTSTSSSSSEADKSIPQNWNWIEIENGKYLTPIKNQGTCGSCWAFASVSVIESRFAIQQKKPAKPLSVEQVLSCSAALDHVQSRYDKTIVSSSQGCEGGMPYLAFEYLKRQKPNGIACEQAYPYIMSSHMSDTVCRPLQHIQPAVKLDISSEDYYVTVTPGSEEELLRAVMEGPVTANIDAHADTFRLYGSGIYDALDCKSDGKTINHAIVIVGFGETEEGDKYWVIRNTWGTMWGEKGYMRIRRTQTGDTRFPLGPCNLYMFVAFPGSFVSTITSGDNSNQEICPFSTDTQAETNKKLHFSEYFAAFSCLQLFFFCHRPY